MDKQLMALEAILRDEVAIYGALVSRLPFKIALIKKNRVPQLERITQQEEADYKRLAELEKHRAEVVQEILALMPKGVGPQLTSIAQHVALSWRDRLLAPSKQLVELARELKEGHETCRVLLRASLEFVDFSLQLVAKAANAQPTVYGDAEPMTQVPTRSVLLDWRA
jgi:hypothetical protein